MRDHMFMEQTFDVQIEISTIVDILAQRASSQPDQTAYIFLVDGETQEVSLTYAELDRRARAIAGKLQSLSTGGECALLLYPPGLDYITAFFGCLYAGIVAVPAYPPHSNRSLYRIQAIVDNSQARIVLTTEQMKAKSERWFTYVPDLAALQWVATDSIPDDHAELCQRVQRSGNDLAFLQYTSGSTRTPKGVMVSQHNLLHNLAMLHACLQQTSQSVSVSWLPMFHDMGLIAGILQPLFVGCRGVLIAPTAFLQRPLRWLKAISRYGGTVSYAPDFAYELCVRRSTSEELADLDLSSWQVTINGAEPVRSETIDRFTNAFEQCGFRREVFSPGYGLAEGTLMVTCGARGAMPVLQSFDKTAWKHNHLVNLPVSSPAAHTLVGCGRVGVEQKIVIAHPEDMTLCQPDEIGEIWVAGGSVAQGYWRAPAETEQVFEAYMADTGDGPFLRTGDLGFIRDGELFVAGRLKDLIISRGQNYYPQDIELTVERSHPALRPSCGAAFSIEVADDEYGAGFLSGGTPEERLVVVQEVQRHFDDLDDIFAAIRQTVVEAHEIDTYAIVLIKQGSIAKTSSGKIQRRACREQFLADELDVVAIDLAPVSFDEQSVAHSKGHISRELLQAVSPEEGFTLLEGYFLEQVGRVLGSDVQRLDADKSFTSFGISSLKVAELKNRLEVDLGIDMPIASFFQDDSWHELIREMLSLIAQEATPWGQSPLLAPAHDDTDSYYLSSNQEQIWFFDQLKPASYLYNIPLAMRLQGYLDIQELEARVNTIIERHETLRTRFVIRDGVPVQEIQPFVPIQIRPLNFSGVPVDEREALVQEQVAQDARKPFDLRTGPLFRISVLRLAEDMHVLLCTWHHTIADEWSVDVFLSELSTLYGQTGAQLPDLPVKYGDYAHWQRHLLHSEYMEQQIAYWKQQLENVERLELPTDRPVPAHQSYSGKTYAFTFPQVLTQQVKLLARDEGVTLFMALLASFIVLLARYSGQEDIAVGTPIAARTKTELEAMIGYFANMLVLRTDISGAPGFSALLERVRNVCIGAYTHQDLPFLNLVEELQPDRDSSLNPFFQVFFTLKIDPLKTFQLPGLVVSPQEIPGTMAKFNLSFSLSDGQEGLEGQVEYNTDLFDEATIVHMVANWEVLLKGIVTNPERCILDLPLLTAQEQQRVLYTWNATEMDYPADLCLHELFEAQVRQTPDAIALVFEGQHLTYQELNQRANQLASYLSTMEVRPEVPVGLYIERSLEMVIGLLGILKAGGIYVPLDPSFPQERLAFIVEDLQLAIVVTAAQLLPPFVSQACRLVCLDRESARIFSSGEVSLQDAGRAGLTSACAAYVIYTSGSSGKPKGVLNTHRALSNRLHWMCKSMLFSPDNRFAQKTPFSFDASLWEFFAPWMSGACLVVARPGGHQDSAYLIAFLVEQSITVLQLVPTMLQALLQEPAISTCTSLQHVFCGGEKLSLEVLRRFYASLSAQLHNLYGPTEASIDVTHCVCPPEMQTDVPIGHPIANTDIYLLDEKMQPVPIGVPGELHIGGTGLARGYLNRPDLTAEKFVPHPFSQQGARLYKTGDLARYWPDGSIEYLGRLDRQAKLHGYRIELGEIDSLLTQHPAVQQSVTMIREDIPGHRQLVAYIILQENTSMQSNELRQFLQQRLPFFMVPSLFILLPVLPRLLNGKINYKALPVPVSPLKEQKRDEAYTPLEQTLRTIWEQVLGVEPILKHYNFFELGGHSLLATKVINQIREVCHVEIPLHLMFEAQTLTGLATCIEQLREVSTFSVVGSSDWEEGVL